MEHNVMMVEFVQRYVFGDYEAVALFDGRDLSEEEALQLVRAGAPDSRIITMEKQQYETVFRSLMGKEERDHGKIQTVQGRR